MTQNEKRILRPVIKDIIRYDKEAWVQLKREIWDLGYQSYYDAQGDFLNIIERAVFNLEPDVKHLLKSEWNKTNPKQAITYSSFHSTYVLLILEEVIERARSAAMRTVNWD